ncbi:MAG: SDR family oxidoreductase [Anaerolineae bacterium]|nr:SDR family oxidoreductase [Anaerolineae bacterium]
MQTVLVTGGAGYVGAVLVPRLLAHGYRVKVLDLFIYGDVLPQHPNLEQIKGDIRDTELLKRSLPGCDSVIHLACISNDPSFDLAPDLSRSINYDAFRPLVAISKQSRVKRFIYASTSSVYGVSDAPEVTEDHPLVPLTDYNKYKGLCEPILAEYQSPDFTSVTIRPATVCGYSPRQRLDLTVNILTTHAVCNGKITVFGGAQQRPNIHIEDMVDLYLQLLQEPDTRIAGKTFNAGYQNHTVSEIANIVRNVVERTVPGRQSLEIVTTPSNDNRSYHISSEKIRRELGFVPKRTIEDAVCDLCRAFAEGKLPDALTDSRYYNIKRMKEIQLA